MLQKIRVMGLESKYSTMSFISVTGVIILHLIHWFLAPLVMGATAGMNLQHRDMAGKGSVIMDVLLFVMFLVNLTSMYFACRQLALAWRKRAKLTRHTYMCSAVSVIVLAIGVYTMFSL
ncbi:hypothetical protein ACFOLF_29255 [Paenibacillus sepulcri]|uniref:Uncharacterized protein n=1 Tax=Paenibacillus sepulcri TaxID=359917 RepID=A0ABS7BZF8_9BACL|nr:hypothetical protein [Paenibacillus sepulcri]